MPVSTQSKLLTLRGQLAPADNGLEFLCAVVCFSVRRLIMRLMLESPLQSKLQDARIVRIQRMKKTGAGDAVCASRGLKAG